MKTGCTVELIRWPRSRKHVCSNIVQVSVLGVPNGPETLVRDIRTIKQARTVARAVASAINCKVKEIDLRTAATAGQMADE